MFDVTHKAKHKINGIPVDFVFVILNGVKNLTLQMYVCCRPLAFINCCFDNIGIVKVNISSALAYSQL